MSPLNMAAVVAIQAKEKAGPAIRFQLLLWPVTDASFETASYKEFAHGHFLTSSMMTWFCDAYTTDPVQRADDFGLLNALAAVPEVRTALRQAGAELAVHLR